MDDFRIIVSAPFAHPDPSIAIAGCRAGAIGVLDFEYVHDPRTIREGISRLSRYVKNFFGTRLSGEAGDILPEVTSRIPPYLKLTVLTYTPGKGLGRTIGALKGRGLEVLVECRSVREAVEAQGIGADGIIAKGLESGGRIGDETTFLLVQRFLKILSLPVYARGGIGLHTSAACRVAGTAGILLDNQLAMTRESPLPAWLKSRIPSLDGSETRVLGNDLECSYRLFSRPGMPLMRELENKERELIREGISFEEKSRIWRKTIISCIGWDSPGDHVVPMGQDIGFAASLAQRFGTVGGIVEAIRASVESHCRQAAHVPVLKKGSSMAQSHGTPYPIVQGPMARVSDTPGFIREVARGGALPFVAVAWSRGEELNALLSETRSEVGDAPWGVGMIGFLSSEHYKEQVEVIVAHKPPFALIAGGQPGQARVLEKQGIATYLHVPSPGLLKIFIKEGVRRFVFEGREAGGHVGPLGGFALWESQIDLLLDASSADGSSEDYHILFAGGIHDALSAAMVAAMAAPLAGKGVRVGIQLGTAYLFTEEAVATGSVQRKYLEEALRCEGTTLLVTGPGHEERCLDTPFARAFKKERLRLTEEGVAGEKAQEVLDRLKRGRLRIASKGMVRNSDHGNDNRAPRLLPVGEDEQYEQGLYLIGQLSALRKHPLSIQELHEDLIPGGSEIIRELEERSKSSRIRKTVSRPSDIAIIGVSCLLPGANRVQTYWENILNKVNAIREVPAERWDWRLFYDRDRHARDKSYSKWGAFLEEVPFDPFHYGIPPNTIASVEPLHLLALETVRSALDDAGYSHRPFPRENTSVILGISGSGELGQLYGFRTSLPLFFGDSSQEIISRFHEALPEWTEDSFPGILMNVAAGRIANRFNLGGLNFTVDAACASSLAALYVGVRELEARTSDMAIVGSADCMQNPFTFMCFSKTQALSPRGVCNALDENADGIVVGEGLVTVVLKRLADAERDGDRIYAVIKGIGASSDGRDKSLTAPGGEGQARAIRRAYGKADVAPSEIELVEAHSTGTAVGDRTEIEALTGVFLEQGAGGRDCAIGSVKSMIGHTKSSAGLASLLKATLALHHKVLPPTMGVKKPNPALLLPESPFYVNTEVRPWIHVGSKGPRAAGVSAFGFGGTNFHVVLEEYTGDYLTGLRQTSFQKWPHELFYWTGDSRREILDAAASFEKFLAGDRKPELRDLSFTCLCRNEKAVTGDRQNQQALSIVASSFSDLKEKLSRAMEVLKGSEGGINDPRGIYYTDCPLGRSGEIAFLFPGQGSQYVQMLGDLAVQFSEIRSLFERSDRILEKEVPEGLSRFVFPRPVFDDEGKAAVGKALADTRIAQPAMGAADLAMFQLLETLGVHPHMTAGHSYGEYVALCAAGAMGEEDLIRLSEARGRFMAEGAGSSPGTMAAVSGGPEEVAGTLAGLEGVWIANVNAPQQTVITGREPAVAEAISRFKEKDLQARKIPVSCAFHSPIMAPAADRLEGFLASLDFHVPGVKVFSNLTARPYPDDPEEIKTTLVRHLLSRVEFVQEIENMYEQGARIFVEVGPGRVLGNLTTQTLGDRPHLAAVSNQSGRSGLDQLLHLLAQLLAHGVPVRMDKIFEGRAVRDLDSMPSAGKGRPKALWLVNGARARPMNPLEGHKPERVLRPAAIRFRDVDSDAGSFTHAVGVTVPQENPGTPLLDKNSLSGLETHVSSTATGSSPDGRDGALASHQRLMRRFLDVQKRVMLDYMKGRGEGAGTHLARMNRPDSEGATALEGTGRTNGGLTVQEHRLPGPEESPANMEASGKAVEEAPDTDPGDRQEGGGGMPGRDGLVSMLVGIVSERTGYPGDMLDLNLDLEAELGIDSIKRVEILSHFFQRVFPGAPDALIEEMEDLKGLRTLGKIIDKVEAYFSVHVKMEPEGNPPEAPEEDLTGKPEIPEKGEPLPRFTLQARSIPFAKSAGGLSSGRVVVVTDDEGGIARALEKQLQTSGYEVALVQWKNAGPEKGENRYILRDHSPEAVRDLLADVRDQQGNIGGLVHLFGLREATPLEEMDAAGWKDRLQMEIHTLFHFAKFLEDDLKQAAGEGGTCVLAATRMGGAFGSDPSVGDRDFFPGNGAVVGFLKTLAEEWPPVRVKAVDLGRGCTPEEWAERLLAEMISGDRFTEVGYDGSHRYVLDLKEVSLEGEDILDMDSTWVILITGGARGITAKVACEMARRHRPTLILAGQSPLPPEKEDEDTAGLTSPRDMKSALIERIKGRGSPVNLAEVEKSYRELCKEREIRTNMETMRQAGATVLYFQVDVRDGQAFGRLIDHIYETYGRLDGVIQGAGIIEDKLLRDKTTESFTRVFETKTESVFTLMRKLSPESLKFLALFSSVAGRFGNQGQCDYTAANEVMNKTALALNRQWEGRVFSVNWGPWETAGMVSAEVKRQFEERGVGLVPPSEGADAFDRELLKGSREEMEVILGDGPWRAESALSGPETDGKTLSPLLRDITVLTRDNGSLELVKHLDPARDLYLRDHRLDAKPVLPAAMAVELMAEAAEMGNRGWRVSAVRDIRVLKGIVVEDDTRDLRVTIRSGEGVSASRSGSRELEAVLSDVQRPHVMFYKAVIALSRIYPDAGNHELPPRTGMQSFWTSAEGAYEKWLFHGPRFQCIQEIEGISRQGMLATLLPSSPKGCFAWEPEEHWALDPIVLDSGPQISILWSRTHFDITPLPSGFRAVYLYKPFYAASLIHCHFQVVEEIGTQGVRSNVFYTDQDGALLGIVEGLETIGSQALNRLAGSHLL